MRQVLLDLFSDFLSAILFWIVFAASGGLALAVSLAVAVGIAQLIWFRSRGRPIHSMQWLSLALVIVLAAGTLATQSPRFMMAKPSIAHFAVAAIMLRRGWMLRYLPPIARDNVPEAVVVAAGYAWVALLAAIGVANIVVAVNFDLTTWIWFISVGAFGAKAVAFAAQYVVFRAIVRRRLLRAALPA